MAGGEPALVPAGRRWSSRLSTGHVVMIVAGLLGVALTLSVVRGHDRGREILVTTRDVVPGTVLDAGAVRTERIDASANVLASGFAPDERDEVVGHVATAPIAEGALVARAVLHGRDDGAAARSMSFPLPKSHAMAGELAVGDRVDVLAVQHDGANAGYVMTGVDVLAVNGAHGGPLGAPDEVTVTIAVHADDAVKLATALETGTVTLVRATGAAPAGSQRG